MSAESYAYKYSVVDTASDRLYNSKASAVTDAFDDALKFAGYEASNVDVLENGETGDWEIRATREKSGLLADAPVRESQIFRVQRVKRN
ncbi:hypothetical protein [Halosimplex halobium]|uniref:hypothetical protein n=1 Tax=Halosimplex halobium TaxID=3396618 RepID=UPI003F55FFA4